LIIQIVLAAYALAISENIFAALPVAVVGSMGLTWLTLVVRERRIALGDRLVLANYGYWLISLVILAAVPATTLITYSFWRWDGRIFFYYAPLLFFVTYRVDMRLAARILAIAMGAASILATVGLIQFAFGESWALPLVRTETTTLGPAKFFFGLHESHNGAAGYYAIIAIGWVALLGWGGSHLQVPRLLAIAAVVPIIVALTLTVSREALTGFYAAVGILGLFWFLGSRRGGTLLVLVLAAVLPIATGATDEHVVARVRQTAAVALALVPGGNTAVNPRTTPSPLVSATQQPGQSASPTPQPTPDPLQTAIEDDSNISSRVPLWRATSQLVT